VLNRMRRAAGQLNRRDRLKHSRRPAQATRSVWAAHPWGRRTRPAGGLQPDRTRDSTHTRVRAARQLGTSPPAYQGALNARAELLEQGGPALWQEFMDELRRSHLRFETPVRSPSVRERLSAAYLAAANAS